MSFTAPPYRSPGATPVRCRAMSPVVAAVRVGVPVERSTRSGRAYRTALAKAAVDGPVHVGVTNLDGDEQSDLAHHGGVHKAVLAYAADHYRRWSRVAEELAAPGAFGENLTVGGLDEQLVCLGDVWAVGTARLEVSQPRQPCWKLNERFGRDDVVSLVQGSGRTGWYLRVLAEGFVEAGDVLTLIERPSPEWTVARANDVMHHHRHDRGLAAELAAVPALAPSWRATLEARASGGETDSSSRTDSP